MVDLSDKHIVVDGHFTSQRIAQIVASIREYSPELDVHWCPPGARRPEQAAFKIVHSPLGGKPYTVFHVRTEEEFTEHTLQRLIAGDQRNASLNYSELEAHEVAQNLLKKQKFLDAIEEANDIAWHAFKTHKNTYTIDKDTMLKDERILKRRK